LEPAHLSLVYLFLGYWDKFDNDHVYSPFVWETKNFPGDKSLTEGLPNFFPKDLDWKTYVTGLNQDFQALGGSTVKDPTQQAAIDDPHYRAINLEYANEEGVPTTFEGVISPNDRIEMRHFTAQQSPAELEQQLTELCDLLQVARMATFIDLDTSEDYLGTVENSKNVKYGSTSVESTKKDETWIAYMTNLIAPPKAVPKAVPKAAAKEKAAAKKTR